MTGNSQPIIVLVEPQLGQNVGMCARAMLNCGLERLRLVAPRDGWPQESARASAAGADVVLDRAEVFSTLDEALADCETVFATTARERSLAVPVASAEEAAGKLASRSDRGERVAVLFGPEASGLDRDAVARADTLIRFPTHPDFPSLNLAQAVLLFGWEWRRRGCDPDESIETPPPASRQALGAFLDRLEKELDARGFFLTPELRPHSERTLRSLVTRTRCTPEELQFLQGVLSALLREPASPGEEVPGE